VTEVRWTEQAADDLAAILEFIRRIEALRTQGFERLPKLLKQTNLLASN